jgi:glycine C-acetyltransferase/8-amino-7-oxononanoate synthase
MAMGPQLEFVGDTEVLYKGERWTFFGGNDYHRFSRHPAVVEALVEATHGYGINSAGSRYTTGNHPLYIELERVLADFLGTESSLICSAGYLSSTILMQGIAEEFDLICIDETAHASLVDAARQSGKPVTIFNHADPSHLEQLLHQQLKPVQRPLVLTDSIFASMGDLAPLQDYAGLMATYDGRIVCDDAHAVGVIGQAGKGSWEEAGIARELIYQTGTLSKGLGGFGGFVAGTSEEIECIRSRSGAFKGSTPMPLPIAAASIRTIEILRSEPEKIARLRNRSEQVKPRLRTLGFNVSEGMAPICSVTYLDPDKNRILGELLKQNRIFPSFIDYPGSPPGGHYRFTLSSAHSDAEIEALCLAVEDSVRRIQR